MKPYGRPARWEPVAVAWSWEWAPLLAAAAAMVGLAVALLAIDAQSRANRAFALILVVRAVVMGVGALRGNAADPAEVAYFQRVWPYFLLAVAPALAWFASVYPRPRGPLGHSPLARRALLGLVVLAELLYALDHSLVWSYVEDPAAPAALAAGQGLRYTDFGPLAVLVGLQPVAFGAVALLFARDYVRAPPGSPRFSGFLILAGFALNTVFDGTLQALNLASLLAAGAAYPWWPWGWALGALPALALPLALAALAVLARAVPRGDPALRREALRLLALAPLPAASALALGALGREAALLFGEAGPFVLGLWRLTVPVLVTYALLRHQLFDIDLKVRTTVKRGAFTACFVLAFFLGSEGAEALAEEAAGPWVGIAAAAVLTVATKRLEGFTERFAERVMPGLRPLEGLGAAQRAAVYREQLRLAALDGELTAKDHRMLANLRARLGEHLALHRGGLGVAHPEARAHSAMSARSSSAELTR